MQHAITIVIPCYNEEKYIGRTLRHIFRQKYARQVKIIIADACSTDRTLQIVSSLKRDLSLDIEVIKGGTPAVGRNAGAKLATTPYILFLDADITFPNTTAIYSAVYEMDTFDYDMVSTTPVYFGEYDIRAKYMFKLNKISTWLLSKIKPFAVGGFTLVKKQVFDYHNGYDEKATQSEDWLLSRKIKPSKFKLVHGLITQDNRRFKQYGYWNMINLMISNWKNRNVIEHFYKNVGYFK